MPPLDGTPQTLPNRSPACPGVPPTWLPRWAGAGARGRGGWVLPGVFPRPRGPFANAASACPGDGTAGCGGLRAIQRARARSIWTPDRPCLVGSKLGGPRKPTACRQYDGSWPRSGQLACKIGASDAAGSWLSNAGLIMASRSVCNIWQAWPAGGTPPPGGRFRG